MSLLKNQIQTFKDLPFVSFKELNRKAATYVGVGPSDDRTIYQSNAVSFDYIAIFNIQGGIYHTDKGHPRYERNFSFCFNFKDVTPTVRASIKVSKEASIEYSEELSILAFKEKLQAINLQSFANADEFLTVFVKEFDIMLSSTITQMDVSAAKKAYIAMVSELNNNLKNMKEEVRVLSRITYDSENTASFETNKKNLVELKEQMKMTQERYDFLLGENRKNIPAVIRHLIVDELKSRYWIL